MKRLAYWLYGLLFHLFRICPVRKKKVVLFMIHNSKFRGSLKFIQDEMKKRDSEFEFVVVSKKQLFSVSGKGMKKVMSLCKGAFYFYVVLNYHMATAGYIFLNDNYPSQDFYKNEVSTLLMAVPIVCFCVITKNPSCQIHAT